MMNPLRKKLLNHWVKIRSKTEIDSILYEYGLEIEFENKTLEELKYIKNEIKK